MHGPYEQLMQSFGQDDFCSMSLVCDFQLSLLAPTCVLKCFRRDIFRLLEGAAVHEVHQPVAVSLSHHVPQEARGERRHRASSDWVRGLCPRGGRHDSGDVRVCAQGAVGDVGGAAAPVGDALLEDRQHGREGKLIGRKRWDTSAYAVITNEWISRIDRQGG